MTRFKKTIPWLFLTGLTTFLIIPARTDYLLPLMQFIHTDQINAWQIIACIFFSLAGLWSTFALLNIICNFYANKLDHISGNSAGILSSHSPDHGGEKNLTGQKK